MTGFSQAVRRRILERDCFRCVRCGAAGPLQLHHRRPRGAGGTSLPWVNLPANGVTLCLSCHGWVESHRERAYADGWLVRRNSNDLPAGVPLRLLSGALVALHDDGTRQLILRKATA